MAERALTDLRVVDISQGIAGPYATKLLADSGAAVTKVEPPGGDYSRRLGPFPDDMPDPRTLGTVSAPQHQQAQRHARRVGDIGTGRAAEASGERRRLRLRREDIDAALVGADVRRPQGGVSRPDRRPGVAVRGDGPVRRLRRQQPHGDGDELDHVQHRRAGPRAADHRRRARRSTSPACSSGSASSPRWRIAR